MEIHVRSSSSSREGRARRTAAAAGPTMLKASRSVREGRRTAAAAAAMPRSLSTRSCAGLGREEEELEQAAAAASSSSSSSSSAAAASATATPRSFSSRCAGLVKEQRARFYIMRRCVTMLICWRDY